MVITMVKGETGRKRKCERRSGETAQGGAEKRRRTCTGENKTKAKRMAGVEDGGVTRETGKEDARLTK